MVSRLQHSLVGVTKTRRLLKTMSDVSLDSQGYPRVLSEALGTCQTSLVATPKTPQSSKGATPWHLCLGDSPATRSALQAAQAVSPLPARKRNVKKVVKACPKNKAVDKKQALAKRPASGQPKAKPKVPLQRQLCPYMCKDGTLASHEDRLKAYPGGCSSCRFVAGCTPSCWKKRPHPGVRGL